MSPRTVRLAALALLVLLAPACGGARPTPFVIDGHNDLLIHFTTDSQRAYLGPDGYDIGQRTTGQVDLPRLRAGQVGAAIFTVGVLDTVDRIRGVQAVTRLFREIAARHPEALAVVEDSASLFQVAGQGRVAALFGVEGAEGLGGSLEVLRAAHAAGVRSVGLTWMHTNALGDASTDSARWQGLSPAGEAFVRELNRLGMLVDLSHASDSAVMDALAIARAPVIFSHSSARALCPAPRNVPDAVLQAVGRNGGVVMVTFVPYFTSPAHYTWYEEGEARWAEFQAAHPTGDSARVLMAAWEKANPEPPVTLAEVANHVEHVRRVAGIDHVGIGSDFDGMYSKIPGLEDASRFPALLAELARRGWSDEELAKVAHGNFLRVLGAVERAAEGGRGGNRPQ